MFLITNVAFRINITVEGVSVVNFVTFCSIVNVCLKYVKDVIM